ncbi:MAG: hypothetical protein AAGC72_00445 [Planctomycetota bacterium]
MKKKTAGREKTRLPVRVDVLKKFLTDQGLARKDIAIKAEKREINVGIGTVHGVFNEGIASPNAIKAFAVVLSIKTGEFVKNDEKHRAILDPIDDLVPRQARQRIHTQGQTRYPGDPFDHCIQDKKNIIKDLATSRALITATGVPSLFESIYNSATFTPIDDAHKDKPFVPGMDYNHFLMIGAVLIINTPQKKVAIGYHRSPNSDALATYKHVDGLSILWATGFEFNLKETMDLDMWDWMNLVSQSPEQAEDAFIGKDDPTLLRLLSHKLTLTSGHCSIRPLCVITNDQRSKTKNRVYSQYVFAIDITSPTTHAKRNGKADPLDKLMGQIIQKPDRSIAVAFKPDSQDYFKNAKGRVNKMDVAAWQRLHRRASQDMPTGISVGKFEVH